jgi:hypothetical protein
MITIITSKPDSCPGKNPCQPSKYRLSPISKETLELSVIIGPKIGLESYNILFRLLMVAVERLELVMLPFSAVFGLTDVPSDSLQET